MSSNDEPGIGASMSEEQEHDVVAEEITLNVNAVIAAIPHIVSHYVKEPLPTPQRILQSQKFYPYFKDCIGAIDGSHVPEVPPADSAAPFRNRKGTLTQNVLVGCTFNMLIFFCARRLGGLGTRRTRAERRNVEWLSCNRGEVLLDDAGYSLSSFVLTLYRGVRYHLKEWGRRSNAPQTKEELFNLRHSTLRNVTERAVGTVKQKFPVLEDMARYLYPVQVKMVMAIFAIYNFIRLHGGDTSTESDNRAGLQPSSDDPYNRNADQSDDSSPAAKQRDNIATRVWIDYIFFRADRD